MPHSDNVFSLLNRLLPRGAMELSAVCDVVFPDHTHYF